MEHTGKALRPGLAEVGYMASLIPSHCIMLGLLRASSEPHFLYLLNINRNPHLISLLHRPMTQSSSDKITATSKVHEETHSAVAQSTSFRATHEFVSIFCDLP